jgi:hypothetical protein
MGKISNRFRSLKLSLEAYNVAGMPFAPEELRFPKINWYGLVSDLRPQYPKAEDGKFG